MRVRFLCALRALGCFFFCVLLCFSLALLLQRFSLSRLLSHLLSFFSANLF